MNPAMNPPSEAKASPQITVRRVVRLLVLILIAAVLTYYWNRQRPPAPPSLPAIDLTKAEEPVAAAIEAAMNRVREKPQAAHAWGFLGEVLLVHTYARESIDCFERAAQLDPNEPRWPYFQALALAPSGKDNVPLLERAVALCDQHDPTVTGPRLALAERLLERRHFDEAGEQLQKAEAIDPNDPRLIFNRGILALRRNDLAGARDFFSRLVDSPVARKKAYSHLAAIYLALNQRKQAEQCHDKERLLQEDWSWDDPYVIEYTKLDVSHHSRLRKASQLADAKRLDEAQSVVEELLQDSKTELNQLSVATNLCKQGRNAEAAEVLTKLLRESPNKVQAHYTLGMVRFYQGIELMARGSDKKEQALARYRESVASCQRTIELKSDHAFAHLFLGRALQQLGERENALAALRKCVELRPEAVSTRLYLGDTLGDEGKYAEALEHIEIAVKLAASDNSKPREALERLRAKMNRVPK
jgi:tetratricopeptide (TPR) repeat protein